MGCRNRHKERKQRQNKCHFTSRTQPTKHYCKKQKNFKNTAYYLHNASISYKKKNGVYKQKRMQENMRKLQHVPGIPNLAEQGNPNVPLVG
jgi:hypothetical protein